MDSNITNEQYFNDDLSLTEPHFEEEATLLSARPVVPLGEVERKGRSKKGLALGLAIASALVFGALGATLIYKQRGQIQSTEAVSAAVPGAAGIPVPQLTPALAEEVGGAASGISPKSAGREIENKTLSPVSPVTTKTVETKRRKPLAEPLEERELSRSEQIEAWRLRRRAEREERRESGSRRRRYSDDLLRIREIFEGPRP